MRRRELLGALAAAPAVARAAGTRRPLAVALGSGSMHGLAHIGIVRACEKLGLVPELVVGSSVGAAVGALWAAGLDAAAIERTARSLDWTHAAEWTVPWRGLKRPDGLRRALLDALGGARRIEALPRRFAAVATGLADGARVVLDRGPVDLAVAASSAIPVLFVPVWIEGRELVDGSLSAPVPVDVARERAPAAVVLAVDVAYRPSDEPPRLLSDIAFQALHILVNALAAEQIARADLALRLDLHHLMREGHVDPSVLIDAGERALTEAWPRLQALLDRPVPQRPPRAS